MARGEELKMRPVREEISQERAKDIMSSTPAKTERALSEEKARRRQE